MKVKLILPALTEATSPLWRPIKYSLFPPLGLATLAAYLDDHDIAEFRMSTSSRSDRRRPGSGRDPGLHHVGAAAPIAWPITTGGVARTSRWVGFT